MKDNVAAINRHEIKVLVMPAPKNAVSERYNSQTPVYRELLKTLRQYTDRYYGIDPDHI